MGGKTRHLLSQKNKLDLIWPQQNILDVGPGNSTQKGNISDLGNKKIIDSKVLGTGYVSSQQGISMYSDVFGTFG